MMTLISAQLTPSFRLGFQSPVFRGDVQTAEVAIGTRLGAKGRSIIRIRRSQRDSMVGVAVSRFQPGGEGAGLNGLG